ncbi:L,D-transpeptidase [Streptomyces sp. NPDC093510]|uniref:L,D-transpeptidase n=1 Tax=Streptomyces sp. NPDC093510 TaxID=3155199 RepID=UPI00342D1B2E
MTTGNTITMRRATRAWGAAALCSLALAGCSGQDGEGARSAAGPKPAASAADRAPSVREKPRPVAEPAAFKGMRVNVSNGQTVGVGMPISLTFDRPVPVAERAAVERRLKVAARPAVTGSWSWVKDRNLHDGQRVDYRPGEPWKPGTKVTFRAGTGTGRTFQVGRSLVATVDVRSHTMTVVEDGVTRRVKVTAGAAGMDTWNGTMVVLDKQSRVLMDSRTVGYGKAYKDYYNYAVHLTTSGTYLHENPNANATAGERNVTHGCIGLATDGTARRFYEDVIPGDIVRVVGSKETVAAGNGYGGWNVDWKQWRAGSALN